MERKSEARKIVTNSRENYVHRGKSKMLIKGRKMTHNGTEELVSIFQLNLRLLHIMLNCCNFGESFIASGRPFVVFLL